MRETGLARVSREKKKKGDLGALRVNMVGWSECCGRENHEGVIKRDKRPGEVRER